MVPKSIQPYFNTTLQKAVRGNSIVEGALNCCNGHDFEVLVVGKAKHRFFTNTCLYPENDIIIIKVRCKRCGKIIQVFNSTCDGYEHCGARQSTEAMLEPFNCRKCRDNSFSVTIKYEYPAIQELKELGILEVDNAFTWIWITLKCNECGTVYRNFIDFETA